MEDLSFFKQTIANNEYAFLIGNGINRAYGGNDWTRLLKNVIKETIGEESFLYNSVGQAGITNTEVQNIIPLEYDRKRDEQISSKDLMSKVCKNTQSISFDHAFILDYAVHKKLDILTTNYDFNIEKYLWKNYCRVKKSVGQYVSSSYYPWDKFYYSQCMTPEDKTCRVWHIHGDILHWQSIILSLSRYLGSVKKAMELIHHADTSSPQWKGSNTWLHSFFNKPLIITGLSLDPQELFLRWLLIERTSKNRKLKQTVPPSFYITRESNKGKESPGKKQFLEFLDVKTIYFPDNDIYKHQIWNTLSN